MCVDGRGRCSLLVSEITTLFVSAIFLIAPCRRGSNSYGQRGDGSVTQALVPPSTDVIAGVATVATGRSFTCVQMTGSGGVRCWGDDTYGQLGNGGAYTEMHDPPVSDVLTGLIMPSPSVTSSGSPTSSITPSLGSSVCDALLHSVRLVFRRLQRLQLFVPAAREFDFCVCLCCS